LHHKLKQLSAAKLKEDAELEMAHKKALDLQEKFYNSTSVAERSAEALKWAQVHLDSLEKQNSGLIKLVRNATTANKDLVHKFNETVQNHTAVEASLKDLDMKLQRKTSEQEKAIKSLKTAKADLQRRAEVAEKQEKLEEEERVKDEAAMATMKKQVADEKLSKAVEQQKVFDKLANLVKNGQANYSRDSQKMTWMASTVRTLEKQEKLTETRASEAEKSRDEARKSAANATATLTRVESDVRQLRGAQPWLEAKLASVQDTANKADVKTASAIKQRDAAQAALRHLAKKMKSLETQYAGVVQVLGKDATQEETDMKIDAGVDEDEAAVKKTNDSVTVAEDEASVKKAIESATAAEAAAAAGKAGAAPVENAVPSMADVKAQAEQATSKISIPTVADESVDAREKEAKAEEEEAAAKVGEALALADSVDSSPPLPSRALPRTFSPKAVARDLTSAERDRLAMEHQDAMEADADSDSTAISIPTEGDWANQYT